MKRWTVGIVAVMFSMCAAARFAGAATLFEDFSGGIQPDRWDILRFDAAGAPWTLAAPGSSGGLRLSKAADSDASATYCFAGVASRFQLIGDFSVSVGFDLVGFPRPDTAGWNEAILRVGFLGTPFIADQNFFEVLRYTDSTPPQDQWVEGWSSQPPPFSAFGTAVDPTLQGTFSITRTGETLSAWIDRGAGAVLIGSETSPLFTAPANVQLVALQQPGLTFPRPSTLLDVRFDNLSISAAAIVPEPSSLALLTMGALALTVGRWRGRRVAGGP